MGAPEGQPAKIRGVSRATPWTRRAPLGVVPFLTRRKALFHNTACHVHSNSLASSRAEPSPLHAEDVVTMEASTAESPLRTLRSWKFVTHHAQVLLAVAHEP